MAAWSTETTPASLGSDPWMSELLPDPATPVTTVSTPRGMSTSTFLQVVLRRVADLEGSGRLTYLALESRAVIQMLPGECAARAQRGDSALELDLAAVRSRARTEVDHVIGDRDHLGLVLDDEHGVALVAQAQQQFVHALDVVRVQPDRRLVEDVGDVGEAGAEVADHLGALRLAAGKGA